MFCVYIHRTYMVLANTMHSLWPTLADPTHTLWPTLRIPYARPSLANLMHALWPTLANWSTLCTPCCCPCAMERLGGWWPSRSDGCSQRLKLLNARSFRLRYLFLTFSWFLPFSSSCFFSCLSLAPSVSHFPFGHWCIPRVGQNCMYTPYMTIYLVISLLNIPYIHHTYMVLANPMRTMLLPLRDGEVGWLMAISTSIWWL